MIDCLQRSNNANNSDYLTKLMELNHRDAKKKPKNRNKPYNL